VSELEVLVQRTHVNHHGLYLLLIHVDFPSKPCDQGLSVHDLPLS
jgi:hypothetical protein